MLETTDHQIAMVSGHLKNHYLSNQRGIFSKHVHKSSVHVYCVF